LQSGTIRANGAGLKPIVEMIHASSPANGLLLAISSATLYGFNIVFARLASFAGVTGSTIMVYRVLAMLAIIAIAAALMRRSLTVAKEERGRMLVLGVSTALIGICYLSSAAFIPVAVAVVVFYTFPILIVLASPFVEGTRLTPTLIGVVALASIGIVMVVGPAFNGLDWRGLALAFSASVATAVQFFAASRCRKTGVVAKVFWIHVLVLPTATLIGLALEHLAPPSVLAAAPFVIAMSIGGYILGFVLQLIALGRITAIAAGIIYCAEPVVAALSSVLILGETISPLQMAGGALVLAAIVANVLSDRRSPKDAPLVPLAD
jgi:drug/metabolite transporter (DMT)-like permease